MFSHNITCLATGAHNRKGYNSSFFFNTEQMQADTVMSKLVYRVGSHDRQIDQKELPDVSLEKESFDPQEMDPYLHP